MRLTFVLSFLVTRAACNRFECTDDSSFALQNRLPCEMWVGRNCWIAHEVLGYSAAEEAELLEAARACRGWDARAADADRLRRRASAARARDARVSCTVVRRRRPARAAVGAARRRRGRVRRSLAREGAAGGGCRAWDAAAAGRRMQRARAVDIEDISLHDEMRLKRAPGEFDDAIGDAAAAGRVPAGRVRTSDDVDGLD